MKITTRHAVPADQQVQDRPSLDPRADQACRHLAKADQKAAPESREITFHHLRVGARPTEKGDLQMKRRDEAVAKRESARDEMNFNQF
jgi:hypothetical protein